MIFKIVKRAEWRSASADGIYRGSAVDLRDGFIHFSTAHQVRETAAKHFKGQTDLVLLAFDEDMLTPAIRWEPSRGGDLFPHLYGELPTASALWERDLPLDSEGLPIIAKDMLA